MNNNNIKIVTNASKPELEDRNKLVEMLQNTPIPDNEILMNFPLYLTRQNLTHILYMDYLYKKIVGLNGNIMEFGCRWGRNLALFENLRGMYEPYNYNRKIIGFDTFTGFAGISSSDKIEYSGIAEGDYSTTPEYIEYLQSILNLHILNNPISHIKKYEIIAGDIENTLNNYLTHNPHTIVSLVYFDFDIYKPTKQALQTILPYIHKGAVVAFDELNFKQFPGETQAFREVFDLNHIKLRKYKYDSIRSYFILGE